MSESGPHTESRANVGGDVENQRLRPRWLVGLLVATVVLIIVAVGAYLMFGRELFQRPFLMVAVVIAWLGALVGVSIGNESR